MFSQGTRMMRTRRLTVLVAGVGALLTIGAPTLLAAAAGAGGPNPSFTPSGLIAAGTIPCSFAVARLDGDENLDLAISNCYADNVTVLLGDGAGHFRRATGSPTRAGDLPSSLSTADFNGDGNADLAVANQESKDVTVLLGNGSGGFGAAPGSPLKIGASPRLLDSADLNGDGRVDLAVPAYPNRLVILLGDGSGRFGPVPGSPLAIAHKYGPQKATVAELNGDAKPDLVISTVDPMRIAILLGDGAGGFRVVKTIQAGLKAVGDFNGDAKPDLAVATRASSRAPYKATVLLGTRSGQFSTAPGLRMESNFWSTETVAADLNSDHKLDLALRDYGVVSLLLGDGRGRFRAALDGPLPLPARHRPAWGGIAATDLNRDGQPDLVVGVRRSPQHGGEVGLAVLWRSPSRPEVLSGGRFPSPRDAVFSTRAPIWALAGDGKRAGVLTARFGPCGRIRIVVWTAPRRRSSTINDTCRGDAVTQVAIGGGQVAWLEQGGGNDLELILRAARISGGKPKEIEFVTNGNRGGGDPRGSWLGHLLGSGSLLAYNSWLLWCNAPESGCDGSDKRLILRKQRLFRIVAGRRVVAKRGPASYALAAVGGGRMAVESAGAISVLRPNGSQVSRVPAVNDNPPRAIALSRTRLAVLRTFTLDLYEPATGRATKSIPLGPADALQLGGVNSTLAVLRNQRRLIVVRLSDGKLISLALRTKSHLDAKLTSAGLFYAYNVRRGRAKGRIVFEPTAKLSARF